jgi:23S rRNA (cytidine2498-2'-O)-methyltransferase
VSQFAIFTCQAGAEMPLKREIAESAPQWVPAFSRPGVVTMKNTGEPIADSSRLPPLVFARTRSLSLGRITGEHADEMAPQVWSLAAETMAGDNKFALHVWQRDEHLPGDMNFEPHISPLAEETRAKLLEHAPADRIAGSPAARIGSKAIDVLMVEPGDWLVGWHRVAKRSERWPGGLFPIEASDDVISRAYLKLAEALAWAQLPTSPGELWVEIGCAPGGASQCLLDHDFRVIGIDPADIDESLQDEPRFVHLKMRSADVPRRDLQEVRWLAADMNVAPRYTLDAVESIVGNKKIAIRGLVLTLKLSGWHLAVPERLASYAKRVQSWGFRDVRIKQLAHNRHELCLVAMRSRGQRRVRR